MGGVNPRRTSRDISGGPVRDPRRRKEKRLVPTGSLCGILPCRYCRASFPYREGDGGVWGDGDGDGDGYAEQLLWGKHVPRGSGASVPSGDDPPGGAGEGGV